MNEPIHVLIDTIPTDPLSSLSLWVSILSGILVPIFLVIFTWYTTKQAEKRSKEHTERLILTERKQVFSNNVHVALDNLYKAVQRLRKVNLNRKRYVDWGTAVNQQNDKIMASFVTEAKVKQTELLQWHLDKLLELDSQHWMAVIDVTSAQVRVQHLLKDANTKKLDENISIILKASEEPGMISDEIIQPFIEEINALFKEVEITPDKWVTL